MHYTKKLLEFVMDTQYKDIPSEAVGLCKKHFLDCTGSALAAVNRVPGNIIDEYVKSVEAAGHARLIGYGLRTSADYAAFGNGILAHVMSFDDSGPSHPSVTIVPPLYALGEAFHLKGREILTAQALAYEVFQKLNLVTKDAWEMRDRGWHPTGYFGAVTSSCIAIKLLNLTVSQGLNAVGIAASMGGGLSQNIGNMTMSLHAGNASRNGIIAALLAKKGFTGDVYALEGRFGLLNALAGVENYEIEDLVKNLGSPFAIINPGINIKPYPNCWAHQKVYDAVLYLVAKHDIKSDDVAGVWCDLQPEKPTYRYLQPVTDLEARYSLGYGIAICLLDRKMGLEQYSESRISDEHVRQTMSRIHHEPQSDILKKHVVKITLNDGATYTHLVEHSKGIARRNPLSDDELKAKYEYCAQGVLPAWKIKRSMELISEMENLNDIATIMDAVTI